MSNQDQGEAVVEDGAATAMDLDKVSTINHNNVSVDSNSTGSWNEEVKPNARKPKRRWDLTPDEQNAENTPRKRRRWDEEGPVGDRSSTSQDGSSTAKKEEAATPINSWNSTPRGRWDQTGDPIAATPIRTDPADTPVQLGDMTPIGPWRGVETPVAPPIPAPVFMTPVFEVDERNKPWTDEELDEMFPTSGYEILVPPADYNPPRRQQVYISQTPPTPAGTWPTVENPNLLVPGGGDSTGQAIEVPDIQGLTAKPEDYFIFQKILTKAPPDEQLSIEEAKERKILKLLLKVKNGTPQMRKQALRQITEKATEFGAQALFCQLLPLMMSATLEDQERHLLVKVIDRILYKLDELVRPFVHEILVVIEPLLIDEDYYARVEGKEVISNLSKAAGLATMIASLRPDIDNPDEYVRNTTARAFSVVASAMGIPSLFRFLKAVCQSKKSPEAKHTGIKIVQQIAILMGCAVLPHLKGLVEIVKDGLEDDNQKVKIITALALAALAEAAAPYGIESFAVVLKPICNGIKKHKGKTLAAFLKAIGYIIPLMDPDNARIHTEEVMTVVVKQFITTDDEMKKIVLKVVKQAVGTEGVTASYIKDDILGPFFRSFWITKMALDRRNYKQLVDTTVELANKAGASEVIQHIVDGLREESELYRRMVMETVEKIIAKLGAVEIGTKLEEQLINNVLFAFVEEQSDDNQVMLNGFGTVLNAFGARCKPYLDAICNVIKDRLNNKSPRVRQQAADLISRIAVVFQLCGQRQLIAHLGLVLYEHFGEEFPEVLGSILGGLKAIVNVIGMAKMRPPINELLPRLTPILKNRHEKVQENCIDLVGRIADRGHDYVGPREWMRICSELLDMLKAHKKGIRRAAVNTFGYIAKAIGPLDVLKILLDNLRVQERQNRVCTTVAIAIVAETSGPFTVLPALMNEYGVPELNVQNGVLKALSFVFEYIGEMAKDYCYAVTPLLEDALIERDPVHRQIACTVVKHMSLGVQGLSCEDAILHLLNFVWPNIFEVSPHVINAVMEAIEGCRVALGPSVLFYYTVQGLFHPSRKVREIFWRIYNMVYIGAQDALVAAYPRMVNVPTFVKKDLSVLDSAEPEFTAELDMDVDGERDVKKKPDVEFNPANPYRRVELEMFL